MEQRQTGPEVIGSAGSRSFRETKLFAHRLQPFLNHCSAAPRLLLDQSLGLHLPPKQRRRVFRRKPNLPVESWLRVQANVFPSIDELRQKFQEAKYIVDAVTLTQVYITGELKMPVLIEGPPGCGKT